MKAVEFVKNFGWDWAKEVVKNQPETDAQIFNPYNQKYSSSYTIKRGVSVAYLKQLIEAKELVSEHGTIERAKKYAESKYTAPEVAESLQIAIQLVESVNA